MSEAKVRALLVTKFDPRHVDSILKHFVAAAEKFASRDWDGVALKAGKFVEAVTKALMLLCGKTLPRARQFKAGKELADLQKLDSATCPDEVRVVIPRACLFVYEIVNNRGGRHDAGEIDANEMDAQILIPHLQWTLAEMLRFSTYGGDTAAAAALIEEITHKIYPYFEDVDGRPYVNGQNLSAPDIAILLLYKAYPKRVERQTLIEAIVRHGPTVNAANMAVLRLQVVDDDGSSLKLRAPGRQKAEKILRRLQAQHTNNTR